MDGRMRWREAGGNLARLGSLWQKSECQSLLSSSYGSAVISHLGIRAAEVGSWSPPLGVRTLMHTEHSCPRNADRTAWTIPSFPVGQAPPVDGEDR